MTPAKYLAKQTPFFLIDFQSSYKFLDLSKLYHKEIFDSVLAALYFYILQDSPFSSLISISAAFYDDRDIKKGHSIFLAILKILFVQIFSLAFFISNILGNIHLW